MKRRLVIASVFTLILVSLRASAQSVTFYGGYLNPGKLDLSTVRNDLNLRGTGIYGIRFEADFRKILGFEQDFAFSPKLFDSALFPESNDLKGFLYSSNLVVSAPISHFVPYVTAGVGFLKPWGTGFKPFNAKLATNYGGGIKLARLIGPVGLRFDVRGYSVPHIAQQTLHLLEVSGGIMFSR